MRIKHHFPQEVVRCGLEAIRRLVDARGIETTARALGITHQALGKQLDPHEDATHLTVLRAQAIADMYDSDCLAHAEAARRGGIFIHTPDLSGTSDIEILSQYTRMMREFGEFSAVLETSLADGKIKPEEFQRLEKEMHDCIAAGAELVQRLRGMAEPEASTPLKQVKLCAR